jgi:hypothetical protein
MLQDQVDAADLMAFLAVNQVIEFILAAEIAEFLIDAAPQRLTAELAGCCIGGKV